MFDLCSTNAGAKIFSSKICALTASLESLVEKTGPGYTGSYMISPPVSILLKLPAPRRLHGIGIIPNVGDSRVKNLRVYVCSHNLLGDKTSISGSDGEALLQTLRCIGKKVDQCTLSDCASSSLWIQFRPSWLSGFNQLSDSVVCAKVRSNTTGSARVVETYCKRDAMLVLVDVRSTHRNTRPSLRRLEVWGEDDQMSVSSEVPKSRGEVEVNDVVDLTGDLKEVPQSPPLEFLDPITSDLMRWPMLLPSGNVVDKTTLEKWHVARGDLSTANTDPFTLLPFDPNRRPKFHGLLKARIDQFLRERPEFAGKTVGAGMKRACSSNSTEDNSSKAARLEGPSYPYAYSYRSVDLLGSTVKRCARCSRPLLTAEPLTEQAFRTPCDVTLCRNCAVNVANESSCQRCGARHPFGSIRRVFN